jgi:hypothetical protein
MAAGSTYTPIYTTTLGSAQTSVTLNSFSGYTDLVVIFNGGENGSNRDFRLTFNGDTSALYSSTRLLGDGSTAQSSRLTGQTALEGVVGNAMCTGIYNIMNYANTTTFKTAVYRMGDAGSRTSAYVGLYRSTSAITSMTFTAEAGNTINSGSTFTLYGILSA